MAAIYCTHCKGMVPEGDDICPRCGHPVDFAAQRAMQQPVYHNPVPAAPAEEPKRAGGLFGWLRRRKKKEGDAAAGHAGANGGTARHVASQAPLQIEPEGVTTMLSQMPVVDDDATGVLKAGSNVCLRRLATGEDYSLVLPVTVGRGSASDCHVLGNKAIGRQHVRISQADGAYVIMDLHSTNGTFMRGVQLLPNHPVSLELGETFRMADEEFVLGEG